MYILQEILNLRHFQSHDAMLGTNSFRGSECVFQVQIFNVTLCVCVSQEVSRKEGQKVVQKP